MRFMLLLAVVCCLKVQAQTALQTSFETTQGYTAGTVHNQNNWKVIAGSGTIVSTAHTGTQGLQFIANNTALTAEHMAYAGTVPGITGEVYTDLWIKPVAFATKGIGINGFDLYGGSSKRIFAIEFTTDNNIKVYNGSSGVNASTWVANQWLRISIKMDFATEKYKVAFNGVVHATEFTFRETYTPTASGTRQAGVKEYHSLRFNHVSDAQVATSEAVVDDIYVSTTPISDVSFGTSSTTRTITVTQPEYGTIALSPAGPYQVGQSVTATLTLPQGYMNNGWTGDLSGISLSQTFVVNNNMTIGANTGIDASNPPPKYIITVTQPANGTITLSPAAANNEYYKETKVTATIAYDACYQFNGWTGGLSGTQASNTFTVSNAITIGANVVLNTTPATKRVVTTVTEFKNALNAMNPGDTVEVADGSYNLGGLTLTRSGCSIKPIVITARNIGGAVLTGGTYFNFRNMQYVTFKGFKMQSSGISTGLKLENCRRFTVSHNQFAFTETGSCTWVYIGDTYASTDPLKSGENVVEYNVFDGKTEAGNYVRLDGNIDQQSQHDTIRYNHFKNNGPRAANEKESIRIGVSTLSRSNGYTVVEHNLFQDCDGDPEIVSVKSFANKVRYNTFIRCLGTVCLRQGNGTLVEGNYFFGEGKTALFNGGEIGCGGVRVYGKDHLIINNYFHGLTGEKWDAACTMTNGDVTNTSTSTSSHFLPENVVFAFNTLVHNKSNIEIGFENNGNYNKPLLNCTIANNIVVDTVRPIIKYYNTTALSNVTFQSNLMYPTKNSSIGISATASQVITANPLLLQPSCIGSNCSSSNAYRVYRLGVGSPAINAAQGTYNDVVYDQEQQIRTGVKDIGADEYSTNTTVTVNTGALDSAQVGPFANAYVYTYNNSALPAKLISFDVSFDKTVLLQWLSAEEINLRTYTVEWSIDGRIFLPVTTINANGTAHVYNATHANFVAGKNYYRLRMTDIDGSITYSLIRMINTDAKATVVIYPNPAKDVLQVQLQQVPVKPVVMQVYNAMGKLVWHTTLTQLLTSVTLHSLPAGMYQIRVIEQHQTTNRQLLIQR